MPMFGDLLLLVLCGGLLLFAFSRLLAHVFNAKAIWGMYADPEVSKQKQGFVINKKSKRVEADRATITPFK